VTVVSVSNSVDTGHTFRAGTTGFTLRCNEDEVIRIAWAEDEADDDSTGQWMILRIGEIYWEDDVRIGRKGVATPTDTNDGLTQLTIYMHAPDAAAAVDVAIVEWI
jgi:hypothetical protein